MRMRGDVGARRLPDEIIESPSIQPSADPNELLDPEIPVAWQPPDNNDAEAKPLPTFLRGLVQDEKTVRPAIGMSKGRFAVLAVFAAVAGIAVEIVFFENSTAEWRSWARATKDAPASVPEQPQVANATEDRVSQPVVAPTLAFADDSRDINAPAPSGAKAPSYTLAAVSPPVVSAAPSAPAVIGNETPASRRYIDPKEVAALLKRADEFVSNGDLPAARLLLERVAETHNARAAYQLGATYDPIMIKKLGTISAEPDLALARTWYLRARDWGLPDAARQLEALASADK